MRAFGRRDYRIRLRFFVQQFSEQRVVGRQFGGSTHDVFDFLHRYLSDPLRDFQHNAALEFNRETIGVIKLPRLTDKVSVNGGSVNLAVIMTDDHLGWVGERVCAHGGY